jgi:putative copper resistance protein D
MLTILSDTAFAVIVGTFLAGRWLDAPGFAPDHPAFAAHSFPVRARRRLMLLCTAVFTLVHVIHPWFLAASMSGSNNFASDLSLVPTILSSTHQGTLWYINSVAIAVLLVGTLSITSTSKRAATWAAVVSLLALAFTKAASGHAADDGDFTLAEFSQFLHILSTSVWSGCVLVSGLVVLPRLHRNTTAATLWSFGGRLSTTVTWALAALLVSGIYTSDRELNNTLSELWTSSWGKILIVKIAFVLIAILLGAMGRFLCLGRPAEGERAALMVRLLFTEAAVMICILCLSGLLGNTAPAMSASMSM